MNEQGDSVAQGNKVKEMLEDILARMGLEAKVELFPSGDDEILLHVESPDAARLIGRGAHVLNALQLILNRIVYKQLDPDLHCVVDVERYRERRKDHLLQEAYEAADKVERVGEAVTLAPMNAADRRVVHQALKNRPGISTHSIESGTRGEKRVVVRPAEEDGNGSSAE
jgi:spoIIIJ-associated protein